MLGIAQVFRVSGDAIGTGQALASVLRDARAAQTVFSRDLNGAIRDWITILIISNYQTFAFRNRADMVADKDQLPYTQDITGTGTEVQVGTTSYGTRSRRTDTFNFFARGNFQRQTGGSVASAGASPFVAQSGSNEAWIWYGHEQQPNDFGTFAANASGAPGAGVLSGGTYGNSNQHNYFADDWILGRQQIILQPGTSIDNNGTVLKTSQPTVINGYAMLDTTTPKGTIQYSYASQSSDAFPPLTPTAVAYDTTRGTSPSIVLGLGCQDDSAFGKRLISSTEWSSRCSDDLSLCSLSNDFGIHSRGRVSFPDAYTYDVVDELFLQ